MIAPGLSDQARELLEGQRLEAVVARAGLWGPVMIVGFIAAAVVGSPIPSAPIARAAGAAHGHVWATVPVVVGTKLGALIAFGLARVLGPGAVRWVFRNRVEPGLMGSQSALTATVFASRLMRLNSRACYIKCNCHIHLLRD